jgi:acyl dehydratase
MVKLSSNIEDFKIHYKTPGFTIRYSRKISEKDVIDFARLSGDHNPLHMDEVVASKNIFKKRVAHGMYIASLFSKILADIKYGYSSIYLSQNLKFLSPVYINQIVDILIELIEFNEFKSTMKFKTICKVNEKIVIEGMAEIFIIKNIN